MFSLKTGIISAHALPTTPTLVRAFRPFTTHTTRQWQSSQLKHVPHISYLRPSIPSPSKDGWNRRCACGCHPTTEDDGDYLHLRQKPVKKCTVKSQPTGYTLAGTGRSLRAMRAFAAARRAGKIPADAKPPGPVKKASAGGKSFSSPGNGNGSNGGGKGTPKYEDLVSTSRPKKLPTFEEEETSDSQLHILKDLFSYIWPKNSAGTKARVLTALGLLVAGKLLNIEVPFFFKRIIDGMNIDFSTTGGLVTTGIFATVLAYGGARFGAMLFDQLRNAIFAKVAQGAIMNVAHNTFQHLLNLDLEFHLSRQTGGLTRAIDRGTKGISYVLSAMVFRILPIAFEITVVSGVLTYNYGASFAGVTLMTILLYGFFTIRTTAWRTEFRKQANTADQQAASVALDSLINYESVKFFNNENFQLKRYDTSLAKYRDSSVKVATSLAFLNSGQNLIFTSALTIMMWMGCQGVAAGTLTVGDLVLINQLVFQLSIPLNFLGSVYRDMKQSLIDMETLFLLQKFRVKVQSKPNAPPLKLAPSGSQITFDHVTFGYHPDRPILKDCSFTIPAGEKVAIVGPSGSGKSTILRLVFRFYDVNSGRILIDGQDIREVDLDSLRRAIGVVPQDTPLFNETIMENLRYGNLKATDEEVNEVLYKVKLDSLVRDLPRGVNTLVGERGLMISGGEKQRLAMGRLLLKDAPITFFDEATSALDTNTEQALLKTIHEIFQESKKTNVSIAHRLRTIADADKIIVLKDGKVLEEGNHYSLLAKEGSLYRQLWNVQENLDIDRQLKDMDEVHNGRKQ